MNFSELGLSAPIVSAVNKQGYEQPTPIQAKAIPAILAGSDVMAAAQTGTGKTAGFTLPILQQLATGKRVASNKIRALILTPTRELAAQVAESVATYGANLPLSSLVVYGGVKINPQMMKLRQGVDILVATPGRLLDLYNQNAVRFDQVEVLVLDEADRMLDMGFIREIKKILTLLPAKRQNLLFSATFSEDIKQLAKGLVKNPVEISVSPANASAKTVEQWVYPTDSKKKSLLLSHLILQNNWRQVLVFCKTKHGANRLVRHLTDKKIAALAIHGNKSQGARTKALAQFKAGEINVLVATDIAARGIDIDQLPLVINFELPHVSEDYVHRIGRTGRAGSTGMAISLVCANEFKLLATIERLTKQVIERKMVEGFEPVNELPASKLDTRPFKAKKPKKPKKPKPVQADNKSEQKQQRKQEQKPSQKQGQKRHVGRSNNGNNKTPSNKKRPKVASSWKNNGNKR